MILNQVKKVAVIFIACIGMVMLFGQLVEAQWAKERLSYSTGISINAIAINGNNIFAGSGNNSGIFLSTDNGSTWNAVHSGFPSSIQSLATIGEIVLAGIANDSVYRSTDSGKIWMKAANIGAINELATKGDTAYAGVPYEGVFRSIDSGSNWIAFNSGIKNRFVWAFSINGNDLFIGTDSGIFRITVGDSSWVGFSSGLSENTEITGIAGSSSLLFAVIDYSNVYSNGVYRSVDSGKSWVSVNIGLPDSLFSASAPILAEIGTMLFVGLDSSVYRSLDSGKTWSFVNSGGGGNTFAVSGNRIMVGGIGGFRYSTDGGTSWTSSNTGLNDFIVNSFAAYGSAILASSTAGTRAFKLASGVIGVPSPTGVFRSTDNGNSWTEVNANGGSALAVSGSTVYSAGGGVYSSKDSGATWAAVDTAELGITFSALVAEGTHLFARGDSGGFGITNVITLFRSADSGNSWAGITSNLPYVQNCSDICYSDYWNVQSLACIDNAILCGLEDNFVYRTTDNGTTWTRKNTGLTDSNVQCLASSGSILFAGTTNQGVFISKDTGTTWTASNSGLTNKNIQALFATGTDLFAGTHGGGIFHSADSGKSWAPFNNGLTDSSIQSFGVNDTYLFAGVGPGTYGGSVWRYPLSQVSVKKAPQIRPDKASLKVHSMGRFNPAVSIDFSIPSPEKVSIGIYDLSGHLVTQLDDKLFTAGQHTLQWNARNAGSGCYVVRMQEGESVQVRAVPVVRQ